MSDDRSERLRQRRKQSKERVQQASEDEPTESEEVSKPSKQSNTSKPENQDSGPVKEEQVGTYMYLPESQKKEVERLYNVLKAEYEYEYDEKFEKNRHFFPLLVQYGLDSLESLDASDIKDRLDSI